MLMTPSVLAALPVLVALSAGPTPKDGRATDVCTVPALRETHPVGSSDDAADDPAIWVHPTDPALSLILGTDKQAGLGVYDLDGRLLQFLPEGRLNNIDVRYGLAWPDGRRTDLAAATQRDRATFTLYTIDPSSRTLAPAHARDFPTGLKDIYGIALHRAADGVVHVFVNDKEGVVQQWALLPGSDATIDAQLVRSFDVGGQVEGMVADDELGVLYVGEETVGVWRYGLDPSSADRRVRVDAVAPDGPLVADVEGLAIYRAGDRSGYLIVSSQGDSTFHVYRRRHDADGPNEHLGCFQVGPGLGAGGAEIDGVTTTDGVDVTSAPLGPGFPSGLLVVQDDENPGGMQNFKLVAWPGIAACLTPPLVVDTSVDPRR